MRTVFAFAVTLLIVPVIVGCAAAPTPLPPTAIPSATPMPPTATAVPPTATLVPPTPTPVPPTVTPLPTQSLGTPVSPPILPQATQPPPPAGTAAPKPTGLPGQQAAVGPIPEGGVTAEQRQCLEQKIGAQAVQEIQQNKRPASPQETELIYTCLPLPPGAPPPGCSACQRMPSGVGAAVVINHFGQDATFTLSGNTGNTMHLAKDGGNQQWNLPPGHYSFSANVPGTKIDCGKYNGCTLDITQGNWTIVDLW